MLSRGLLRTRGLVSVPHTLCLRRALAARYATCEQDILRERSLKDPVGFWGEAAESLNIHWHRKWDTVLDSSTAPHYRWFAGAQINTAYNALDVHVAAGRAQQTALIYDSPVTNTVLKLTYQQLLAEVALFAGALANQGVGKGDRVLLYMPMVPEAVVAMLACARLGAVHSVVFGGFAAPELATRIVDAEPKVIVSAAYGIEGKKRIEYKPLLDQAIEISSYKPSKCIILPRPDCKVNMVKGRDLEWSEATSAARPHDPVFVSANDPLYILYTSGTTGQPKGIVRENGGHAVALKWAMRNVMNTNPGDVYWAASDVGWVVGHSFIVYGPLLTGATTIVYEGKPVGTPDPGAFFRVMEDHKVKNFFTAPTAFRAIKKEDPTGYHMSKHNITSVKGIYFAGERLDPDTLHWAQERLHVPIIDNYWQTETGWPIVAYCQGLRDTIPLKPGSSGRPVPGYDVRVLDPKTKQEVHTGEDGDLVIKLPLPPGAFQTLYRSPERYIKTYTSKYPGYYETGDSGFIDKDGYVFALARTDDVINTAGHRLSTGRMEEVISSHPDVAECAVIGIPDSLKGELPVGFVVLKAGSKKDEETVSAELVRMMRDSIGAVASYKTTHVVQTLPKTRSGKILRRSLREIYAKEETHALTIPATIENPAVLHDIFHVVKKAGSN